MEEGILRRRLFLGAAGNHDGEDDGQDVDNNNGEADTSDGDEVCVRPLVKVRVAAVGGVGVSGAGNGEGGDDARGGGGESAVGALGETGDVVDGGPVEGIVVTAAAEEVLDVVPGGGVVGGVPSGLDVGVEHGGVDVGDDADDEQGDEDEGDNDGVLREREKKREKGVEIGGNFFLDHRFTWKPEKCKMKKKKKCPIRQEGK